MRSAHARLSRLVPTVALVLVACTSPTSTPTTTTSTSSTSSTTSTSTSTTTTTTTVVPPPPSLAAELMGRGSGFGHDPEAPSSVPWWANVAGPSSLKQYGDRYQSKVCATTEARCTGTVKPGVPNDDYREDGYFIAVDVAGPVTGPLLIEGYDLAMVATGDNCQNSMPTSSDLTRLAPWYPDAATRYAAAGNTWCSGDLDTTTNGAGGTVATSFVVRQPDNTPSNESDNPEVAGNASCAPLRVPAIRPGIGTVAKPSIYNLLHPTDGRADAEAVRDPSDQQLTFAELFHRWAPLCEIPADQVVPGRYLIQVRTNAAPTDPTRYDPAVTGDGLNRFSLRASIGASPSGSVSVVGLRGSSVRSILGSAHDMALVRVPESAAGRSVRLEMLDVADSALGPGSIRILAPSESSTTLTGCTFQRDNGSSISTDPVTCTMSDMSHVADNGRLLTITVPIPADYRCDDPDPAGCWLRLGYDLPAALTNDSFTVTAKLP